MDEKPHIHLHRHNFYLTSIKCAEWQSKKSLNVHNKIKNKKEWKWKWKRRRKGKFIRSGFFLWGLFIISISLIALKMILTLLYLKLLCSLPILRCLLSIKRYSNKHIQFFFSFDFVVVVLFFIFSTNTHRTNYTT